MPGEHLTIQLLWTTAGLLVTRFIVLSTKCMKGMRTWVVNQVYFFSLKPGREGSLSCELHRLKSQSSGWDLNFSRVTLHEFDITYQLPYIHGLVVSAAASSCRGHSSVPGRAEHLPVNSSKIVKFLLMNNDWRGGTPDWAKLSPIYASAKTWERKESISSNCLNGQLLLTRT